MQRFHRMMVALDNTIFDNELIAFAAHFAEMTHTEKVYFIHIDKDLEVPDHLQLAYQTKDQPALPKDEAILSELQGRVSRHFRNQPDIETNITIREGKPINELLHWARVKRVDLIMVGHKRLSEGSGVTAHKLARNADCNILFVPQGHKFPVRRIIVPFDFSAVSDLAFKTAMQLSQSNHLGEVHAVHIFDVPILNHYEHNMDFEELSAKVRDYKQTTFDEYLKANGFGKAPVKAHFVRNKTGKTAHYLEREIGQHKDAMVVMGATGKSMIGALLIGSVTEKLLRVNNRNPILIIRERSID